MPKHSISISISRLAISLLLLIAASGTRAQKLFSLERDSVPVMRGFQVSFDLFGAGLLALSDYGQYEGAVRLNLHDQWFPIIEVGYGKANHDHDQVTGLSYKTAAPYYRVGLDFNLLRKKHQANRLFAGFRYAFTSYKIDLWREDFKDPVWKWDTGFGIFGDKCSQHWLEVVFGVDAKIVGPIHLGWSVRYKRRLFHSDGVLGNTWYVPGYGVAGDGRLGGSFNFIVDI